MADGISVELKSSDIRKLQKQLSKLDTGIATKILIPAMKVGAEITKREARHTVGERKLTGKTARYIEVKAPRKPPKSGRINVRVQLPTRSKLGIPGWEKYYYPAVQEYGSKKRNIKPLHGMRRAFRATKWTAFNRIANITRVQLKFALR